MRLRNLLNDDDAVSPVIGVILMVAITVILAAVIATFVLGLGPGETQPSASFSFDGPDSNDNMTITHESGDAISASDLYVRGDAVNSGEWIADANGAVSGDSSEVSSGDSAVANLTGTVDDYSIRVVWDNGDNSATLAKTSS